VRGWTGAPDDIAPNSATNQNGGQNGLPAVYRRSNVMPNHRGLLPKTMVKVVVKIKITVKRG
jgi:hypothetical protein